MDENLEKILDISEKQLPAFFRLFFGVFFLTYLCIIISGLLIDWFVIDGMKIAKDKDKKNNFLSIKIPFLLVLKTSGFATILALVFYILSLLIVGVSLHSIAELIFSKNFQLAQDMREACLVFSGLICILISLLFVYITNFLSSLFYSQKSQISSGISKSDAEIVREITR
ncbi:MAG: hypothetical protein QNJ33_11545 [Crocosphaera sp.]|nr:hypothetical protein [Crocosphaera sp.]